jgi:hypothetical protein
MGVNFNKNPLVSHLPFIVVRVKKKIFKYYLILPVVYNPLIISYTTSKVI